MLPEINGVYRDIGFLDLGSGDLGTEARQTISTPVQALVDRPYST